ncbi:MAG: 3'-5' exonuclease [bacterium]
MKERAGFDRKMSREEINMLPIRKCEFPVHLVRTREELIAAIEVLSNDTVFGFDTETKPAFKKGQMHPTALIQLAGSKAVYLFQLRELNLPKMLRDIFSNPHVVKAGVALDDDIKKLQQLAFFRKSGFVELGDVAREAGIKNYGLRGLAAVLLGFRITKNAQLSNWSRETLSKAQVKYAATDAWVSRELYLQLKKHTKAI